MTILQAAAALVLWRSGRFDTLDIALVVGRAEADICRVIDAARQRERGPHLSLITNGRTPTCHA